MSRRRRERDRGGKRLTTTAEQQQFIHDSWNRLAAMAWRGYQRDGRGFIAVMVDELQGEPDGWGRSVFYTGERVVAERGLSYPDPGLEPVVREYDPETSIVVHFWWRTGTGGAYGRTYRMVGTEILPKDSDGQN
jgi:hypothetical protein